MRLHFRRQYSSLIPTTTAHCQQNYKNILKPSATMKFLISAILLAFLAIFAIAAEQPMKQVIIGYPKGTPEKVLEEAKKCVLDAGGYISYDLPHFSILSMVTDTDCRHEYNLILAIAAKVPAKVLDTIQAAGKEFNVLIEEDSTVSINNS